MLCNLRMLGPSRVTLVLFLSTLKEVSLGAHTPRRSKDPGHLCTLMEFTASGTCVETKFSLLCSRGIEAHYLSGVQCKLIYFIDYVKQCGLNEVCPYIDYTPRTLPILDLSFGIRSNITHMRITEWPGECFNVARLQQRFPHLHHFELINSSEIIHFKGHFDRNCKIKKLVLRGLSALWELPGEVVTQMPLLTEIDLRHNVLRHMKPKLLKGPPQLQRAYLGDNKWDCSDGGLDWLAMERQNSSVRALIVDYYDLMCHQQLYRGKPLHKVMDIIYTVRHTCPNPCSCAMTHVVSNAAGAIIPLITVNCSARGLTIPPESLPPSTTTLRLEGNKLNSIRSILQNPQYQRLADLYLDNNSLSSVKELETSDWFTTFRVLSLRGNSLKQVPVYAFDKAFQSNNNIMHVYLSHNPWRCDCHFLPRFKTLLLKYKRVIKDVADIRCPETGNKATSMVQISTMSLGNVCGNTVVMSVSPINIVNIVLATLLMLVLSRFMYDWYQFKKTGKLPWISSILP